MWRPARASPSRRPAASWIRAAENAGLERATVKQYREHVDQHIIPLIGSVKLSEISAQTVRKFEDRLREEKRFPAMVRKIIGSLGSLLADAQEQGLSARNAVRDLRRNRRRGKELCTPRSGRKGSSRSVSIFRRPREIKGIIAHAKGRWRPLLDCGDLQRPSRVRASGLRWRDVDLKAGELHVRQRADRFNEIGKPKSAAGERVVPFGKFVANTLKEWKFACPKSDGDLVFPNGAGKVKSLANIINRGLIPAPAGGEARRNTPGFTRCAISMRAGASIGRPRAA